MCEDAVDLILRNYKKVIIFIAIIYLYYNRNNNLTINISIISTTLENG